MNRAERRYIEKIYRQNGLSKQDAKAIVNANYRTTALTEGQKTRFNYELIIRHPEFNHQKDEFKEWVTSHKDDILTVDKIRNNGFEVTFVEDTQEEQFWHRAETLIPITTATIKLNDGTEQKVALDGVTGVDDPTLSEKINEVLGGSDVSSN